MDQPPRTPHTPGAAAARGWRRAVFAIGAAAAALAGLWGWSHSEGSLATALRALAWTVPASATLQFEQVRGNLQQGGQIGRAHWHQAGLDVRWHDGTLGLDWSRLLQGKMPLTQWQVQRLEVVDTRPAQDSKPLAALTLPLQADLSWRIGQVQWGSAPALTLGPLEGHYRFDGQAHALALHRLDLAQGRYSGQASLGAAAPMPLQLQLQGTVTPTVQGAQPALQLQARAQLQGTLAGASAQLQLQAHMHTAQGDAPATHLQLNARLHPWRSQWVSSATAQAAQLDLASLWPGAPRTQLQGQLQARPHEGSWHIEGALDNALPGPWDRQRLPLHRLQVALHEKDGQWQIPNLQLGWPGGSAQLQGQWQSGGWQGQARIEQLKPALLHTALSGPALSGTLRATQADKGSVVFEAQLQAAGPLTATPAGEAPRFTTHGQWRPGLWQFDRFELRLAQALLQGQGQWQTTRASLRGAWTWAWPGAQGQLQGQLSARDGQGRMQLEVQDAQRSLQWLQRWPSLQALSVWRARGQAHAQAQWQGGWQQADTQLQLQLDAPQLELMRTDASPWLWRSASVQVEGRLSQMQARAQALLQLPQGQARLDTRWQMGHIGDAKAVRWQGLWQQAQLQWTSAQGHASAQLQNPVAWQWDPATRTAQWDASRWRLLGPSPGQAQLGIERGDWRTGTSAAQAHLRAELSDLPLQWARLWGAPETQGDLLLKGSLTLSLQEQLDLLVQLQRSRGRLFIASEGPGAAPLDAGIQTALAELRIQGRDAQLQLQWDTEQAGQLQARLHTRVDAQDPAGLWPAQAPLSGQVTARLPRIGAWSWLAPPGWRVQGALDAAVALGGTRQSPQWSGRLQARDLAARSAVEGIEFSQGQLQARLQAQTMVLEQLSIKGAGAQGGELTAQGQIHWPDLRGDAASLRQVQMALQLTARGLRVSNRADRRLTVSGQVQGRMDQGQMQLSGQLRADQAQFTLPDDTTPTLGDDVLIRKTEQAPASPPVTGRTLLGTPDVRVRLDLGPDFQVQGHGLLTRLAGQVTLVSSASSQGQPRLTGEVRTEGGRFKAYGQQLQIEQGLLRFNGPFDNPQLDIVALRPNLPQRVGVTVAGTALAPRIRLYADPDMPDADKLAWLVLGRSPAGGGAESAVLQQAAMALLGGNGKRLGTDLANALGLDEISLASGSRSSTAGSTATGTAITLGKRLSKDFYLVYESSLSGAFGSLFVFYDLSRRLTLRAQAGDINALDLVYTVRRD